MSVRPMPPRSRARSLVAAVAGGVTAAGLAVGALAAPVPEAAAAAPAAAPAADPPVTLAFAGDVHFADRLAALLKRPDSGLAGLRPYLERADVAMVNLETAVTTRGTPAPKEYHFRAPASAFTAVRAAGVDVVTMANNHAVDYGRVGLTDTLAARRKSPVPVVGIGANATEAYAPAVLTVWGRRVAVLGASQIGDWTLQNWAATATRPGIASATASSRLVAAVRSARARADVVVVYLHWGTEKTTCPDAAQQRLAQQLAAAGADVVVGTHAHRVQGAGWLGTTFVGYGLGNFVWYNHSSDGSSTTGVLTVTVVGRRATSAQWVPLRIAADGVPRALGAAEGKRMLAAWQRARSCTGLAGRPA